MNFAWPWCFLILPLPWLLRYLLAPVDQVTALRVPKLPSGFGAASAAPRMSLSLLIAALAWLLLVSAAARPQMPDQDSRQASGRDLMLAFDVSGSMATADLQMNGKATQRLLVARAFADEFLQRRQGDRVGLIVFGSQAYLHTPLTFDLNAVRSALATLDTGLAGRETALGDAVGLATKYLQPLAQNSRELVVLTDGANTSGTLAPQRAAWLAQRAGVRIHAIGIGAAQDESRDSDLQQMVQQTAGSYLRAGDGAAFERFFSALDQFPSGNQFDTQVRPQRPLYQWPLGLALLLACAVFLRRLLGVSA